MQRVLEPICPVWEGKPGQEAVSGRCPDGSPATPRRVRPGRGGMANEMGQESQQNPRRLITSEGDQILGTEMVE